MTNKFKIQGLRFAALVAASLLVAFLFTVIGARPAAAQTMAPGPSPVCQALYDSAESAARAELVANTTISPTMAADFAAIYVATVATLDAEITECNSARRWLDVTPSAAAAVPARSSGTTDTSGCFIASGTYANRYVVPAGYHAYPGNGSAYGPGARTWGSAIRVCPGPVPAAVSPTASTSGTCNPIAITSLLDRPDAVVNGTPVRLQVRDLNNCVRGLFRNETGIAAGTNFALDLPDGWAAISASVTVAVHREGGSQVDYTNCPIVYVKGPWKGGFGVYEGAFDVVPVEWLEARLAQIQPIQSAECGRTITPVEHR